MFNSFGSCPYIAHTRLCLRIIRHWRCVYVKAQHLCQDGPAFGHGPNWAGLLDFMQAMQPPTWYVKGSRSQLSCPGVHDVPGCPGSWPWLIIVAHCQVQPLADRVHVGGPAQRIAGHCSGSQRHDQAPNPAHWGAHTGQHTLVYVRPCYMFDIVMPLCVS